MPDAKDRPILSRLAGDPSADEAIDAFVINLAECVDGLQDCEARGELNALGESAESLAVDATAAGFDTLFATARAIQQACDRGAAEEARKELEALTELARRIRLGHRGAA